MDAIETKALVAKLRDRGGTFYSSDAEMMRQAADIIEQHEAFRQEVSDTMERYLASGAVDPCKMLSRFIIARPDPLVEALTDCLGRQSGQGEADDLRAALAARGGKITFPGDDDHD